jgi:cytochrome oxidase Cu insertion factor (SCO1/SenC/PrrC family)
MKSSALVFWITVALVGTAAYGSWVAWRSLHQDEYRITSSSVPHIAYRQAPPPGPPIKEFQLTDENGKEFDSKALKGHVWIGSFFYASCPGPCWQLNQALNGVQDEFKSTDLKLVSITCDPKTDSAEVLRRYADRFKADPARWIFLTGDLDYIKRIGRDIFFQDVKEGQHRNSALVIDRNGKISNSFDLLDSAEVAKMKVLLKKLLDEKPSAENADAPGATTDEVKSSG